MRVVLFYHSLISDWNHGNAHFLRGVVRDLKARGNRVEVYEPEDAWSVVNLLAEQGDEPIREFHRIYPGLRTNRYAAGRLDLDEVLDTADLVIAHEWNEPALIARLGEHRSRTAHYRLLFHDTHHRSVTAPEEIERYDLRHFDGVLAYGAAVADRYLTGGWASRVWTWHEAADATVFHPLAPTEPKRDVVWVGNWGEDERTAELRKFLIRPVADLGLSADVWGVRYPEAAKKALERAGMRYHGWVANYHVPRLFANARATVHVPRRAYRTALHGVPTIRPFEAMACGIPLVSAPWNDVEGLFEAGRDYLVARTSAEMKKHLRAILSDPALAQDLAASGLATIRARHTCGHRVDELLSIYRSLQPRARTSTAATVAAVAGAQLSQGAGR